MSVIDIYNLYPYEEESIVTKRYEYVNADTSNLKHGKVYDLTMYRAVSGATNISVHLNRTDRLYLHYDSVRHFNQDWAEAR